MKLPLKRPDLGKTFELRLQIYEVLLPERRGEQRSASGWPPGDERTADTAGCLHFDARSRILLQLQEGIQVPSIDCLLI
jgi:hypothetical protein